MRSIDQLENAGRRSVARHDDGAAAEDLQQAEERGRFMEGRLPAPDAMPPESRGDGKPSTTRRIWLAGWREVAVWKRDQIPLGGTVVGPAVIKEAYTTVLLLEGWDCHRDKSGHLIARRA